MSLIGKIFLSRRLAINNNHVHLIDPIIELVVPFLPTTISFSVFGSVIDSNPKPRYSIELIIKDEKGFEPINIKGDLDNNSPSQEKGIMNIDINFDNVIFRNEGKHTCSLTVDGNLLEENVFYVYSQNMN